MQETPDTGLPLWPDAAERYCPKLFAEWQAAAALIPPKEQQGPEWMPDFNRLFDLLPPYDDGLERARSLGRPLTNWEYAEEYAAQQEAARRRENRKKARAGPQAILAREREARQAALQDLGAQLQRGELVAIGDHLESGKPPERVFVLKRCFDWDYWCGRCGETIRFGDRKTGYVVRKLRVFRREDAVRLFPELFPIQSQASQPPLYPVSHGYVNRVASQILTEHPELKQLSVTEAAKQIAKMMSPPQNHDTVRRYISWFFPKKKPLRAKRKS